MATFDWRCATAWRRGGAVVAAISAAVFAIGVTGASAQTNRTGSTSAKLPTRAAVHAMLPAAIRAKGRLVVAGSFDYPPDDYTSTSGHLVGFVRDLVLDIVTEAGLKVQLVKTPFLGILTGIQAGRYDAGFIFADTKLREQQANFVDFLAEGDSWVVRSDYAGQGTPCGKSIGAGAGSAEALLAPTVSQNQCVSKGLPGLDIHIYPNNPAAVVALQSNRVDAVLVATDAGSDSVRNSGGSLKLLPGQVPGSQSVSGMALPKNDLRFAKALRWACQRAVQVGLYHHTLKVWGLPSIGVKECTINTATH